MNNLTFKQKSFPIKLKKTKYVGITKKHHDFFSKNKIENKVRYCEWSNIAFLENCPNEVSYNTYYTDEYRGKKDKQNYSESKKIKSYDRLNRMYRLLKKENLQINENPKILEIGCGYGYIVSQFAKKFNGTPYGIELNKYSHKIAKNNNINMVGYTIEDLTKTNNFDVVILCQVLEHLINPNQFFNQLSKVIKPGTIFLLEVPDIESGIDVFFHHPFCYSVRGLFLLLNKHKIEILTYNSSKLDKKQDINITLLAIFGRLKSEYQDDKMPKAIALNEMKENVNKLSKSVLSYHYKMKIFRRYMVSVRYFLKKFFKINI